MTKPYKLTTGKMLVPYPEEQEAYTQRITIWLNDADPAVVEAIEALLETVHEEHLDLSGMDAKVLAAWRAVRGEES